MFEQIGTVIIVIVVLVVGAGLGLVAGFVLGRHKGQEMARGVKSEELEEAKTSLENARFENAELSARNAHRTIAPYRRTGACHHADGGG